LIAAAGRLAWPITRAPQNSGKHVGVPVDHVGIAVAARRDQPDVFRNGGMGGARPLTIYNLVEVARLLNICGFQLAPPLCPVVLARLHRIAILTPEPENGLMTPCKMALSLRFCCSAEKTNISSTSSQEFGHRSVTPSFPAQSPADECVPASGACCVGPIARAARSSAIAVGE